MAKGQPKRSAVPTRPKAVPGKASAAAAKPKKAGGLFSQLGAVISGQNLNSQSSQDSSFQPPSPFPIQDLEEDSQSNSGSLAEAEGIAAEVSVVGGAYNPEVISCIACEEQTNWGNSTAYGRDPFKRWCKSCSSAYRCRMDLIKKEKSVQGQSSTDKHWRTLGKGQIKEWYLNQKRKHEKGERRNDLGDLPDVTTDHCQQLHLDKGRKRINVLTTFAKFSERGLLLQKSHSEIADEWKALVVHPGVQREYLVTGVDGSKELALHLFDRVEVYADQKESEQWSLMKKQKILIRLSSLEWWKIRKHLSTMHELVEPMQ
jgi:hypothetical protein